jgi:Tol biopolymer transport system component
MSSVGAPLHRLADFDYGDAGDLSSDGRRLLMDYDEDVLLLPLSGDLVRLGDCADGSGTAIRKRYRLRIRGGPKKLEAWQSLALSPNGRQIAALELQPTPSGAPLRLRVVVFAANGTAYRVVRPAGLDASIDPTRFTEVTWSPRSDELLITHQHQLIVMAPDGSNARVIYSDPNHNRDADRFVDLSDPDWSREGIAFVARDSDREKARIAYVAADGSGFRGLTGWMYDVRHPSWSPDGKTIAHWRSPRQEGSTGVYLMNADGSRARRLQLRPENLWGPRVDPSCPCLAPIYPFLLEW